MNQAAFKYLANAWNYCTGRGHLRCTINLITCHISIEDATGDGVAWKDLCSRLEKELNVKENGLNLYQHFMLSSYSVVEIGSTQYDYAGKLKFIYRHNIDGIGSEMDGDYNQKFIAY